ncbi:MAG: ARPP-1 family domain-containing protein [Armatimonadota bacterium]
MKRVLVGVLIGASLVGLIAMCALGNVIGGGKVVRPPEPPKPAPIEEYDAIDALIGDLEVGPPQSYRGLTIYHVRQRHPGSDFRPLTFDEAMDRGYLTIREKERGTVNTVQVRNDGGRHAFLMGGEIITGSRQDRTFQQDVLMPPRSGWIDVGVYCVEEGRWTPVSQYFSTTRRAVNAGLRNAAAVGAAQERIWAGVRDQAAEQGVVQSPNRAFKEIYAARKVQESMGDYERHFMPIRQADVCGAVAVTRGQILCADVFANEDVFEELWPKLLRSYALDAGKRGVHHMPETARVREFLRRALSKYAHHGHGSTPGAGEILTIRGTTSGKALAYAGEAVHIQLYPSPIRPLLER